MKSANFIPAIMDAWAESYGAKCPNFRVVVTRRRASWYEVSLEGPRGELLFPSESQFIEHADVDQAIALLAKAVFKHIGKNAAVVRLGMLLDGLAEPTTEKPVAGIAPPCPCGGGVARYRAIAQDGEASFGCDLCRATIPHSESYMWVPISAAKR